MGIHLLMLNLVNMQNNTPEKWIEDFDKWFSEGAEGGLTRGRFNIKEVRDFISSVREEAYQAGLEKGALKGERNRLIYQMKEEAKREVVGELLVIADQGEYEELRREVERYFNSNPTK